MKRMAWGWRNRLVERHSTGLLGGRCTMARSNTGWKHSIAHQHCAPGSTPHTHPALRGGALSCEPCHPWKASCGSIRHCHTGERNFNQATYSVQHSSPSSLCVSSVVEEWTRNLSVAKIPEASLSAEHVVAHVLGVTRSELLRHGSAATLSEQQLAEVERLMNCRLARMPLQYILGEWDFHQLTLKLVPPVFIPRPETERLVEMAIKHLRQLETPSPKVLEIGCGSGAISLALLHALPQVECVAVDQSKHAIELTRTNGQRLGLSDRLTVVEGKVTLGARPPLPHPEYDLVVSNPPYVLRKDLMEVQPEIMVYEDLRALDGGKDGLEVVKAVLRHAHHLLLPGRTLLLEVDPCHCYLLPPWLEKQDLDLTLLKVHQDFNKKDRFMEFLKTN